MHQMGKNALKELEKFRKLCSDKDYELVLSDEISFYDYERLGVILESLKLTYLESDLIVRHINKFQEEEEYLDMLKKTEGVYIDWERYNQWLEDFADDIKDEQEKRRVRELFELDEDVYYML